MRTAISIGIVFIMLAGLTSCKKELPPSTKLVPFDIEHKPSARGVELSVRTKPGAEVTVFDQTVTADDDGMATLVIPRSKLPKKRKNKVSVKGKLGEKTAHITIQIDRPMLYSPQFKAVKQEAPFAEARVTYSNGQKFEPWHFDKDFKTSVEVTSTPGFIVEMRGQKHVVPEDGRVVFEIDLAKDLWSRTLFQATHHVANLGEMKVEWTMTTDGGETRTDHFWVEPRNLFVTLMLGVLDGPVPTPEWADTSGPKGAVVIWTNNVGRPDVSAVNTKAHVSTVKRVAIGREHERRTKKCGPYTHSETGATVYRELDMDDATLTVYDRETGKQVAEKTFTASGKCPSSLAEDEGVWSSVKSDKTYEKWLKRQLR